MKVRFARSSLAIFRSLTLFPHFADLAAFTDSTITLPLGKKANKAAALKLRQEIGEMIDDVGMEVEEEDDEQREWEAAQIRRAGGNGEIRTKSNAGTGEKGTGKTYRAAPSTSSFLPFLALFALLKCCFASSAIRPSPLPRLRPLPSHFLSLRASNKPHLRLFRPRPLRPRTGRAG
jgi:hypothetical protein